MGNTAEMVQQAKIIARATSSLVHGIKLEAESQNDSESQTKLLAAAKQLPDATARMVEAAKAAAMNPNDEQCQLALQQVQLEQITPSFFKDIFGKFRTSLI